MRFSTRLVRFAAVAVWLVSVIAYVLSVGLVVAIAQLRPVEQGMDRDSQHLLRSIQLRH
jgi:hypothetical protein